MKKKVIKTLGISFGIALSLSLSAFASESETDVFLTSLSGTYEEYFTDETWPTMAVYESDGEDDAFKYFAFCGDSPEETYHIEFRYGKKLENLTAYYNGDCAYWMASGFLKDAPENMMEDCISLFVTENAEDFSRLIE